MKPEALYKVSFLLAAMDALLAVICSASGDIHFVYFAVLGGLMWATGMYFKSKTEKE